MANEGKMRWAKWLVLLVVAGGALAAGTWYFKNNSKDETEYQTAAVTRGNLTQAVTATGQLNPVVNVQVGSQISGRIQKINVDYNSQVKSNQVIAEIEPSTYKVAVMRAEAQLANAKANLALAEVQARRAEELFKSNLIPAADHDTAVAQLQQAKADVLSAEATLENAQVDLSRCTIFAPVDGVVISRNVDVGQTVAASFNTPTLFLIANDLTKMQIDALVSEADIGGVAVGQDVKFTVDAYPSRTFLGKVSQIRYGAITNQNVVNYDCVVEVNNKDQKLLPGMTANVSIVTAERENVLRVPNAALRFRPPEVVAAEASAPQGMATRSGAMAGQRNDSQGAGGGGPPAGRGGQGGSRGMGGGRGDREGGGGPGASPAARPRPERPVARTIYVLPQGASSKGEKATLTPAQIKTGITDGIMTEVLEGVEENAQVVTGVMTAAPSRTGPSANPFGGGGFRRF